MGYTIEWLVDKRVIYVHGEGHAEIADIEYQVERLAELHEQGIAPIHTISDSRHIKSFPNSPSTLKKLMKHHPNGTGYALLIQDNLPTRFFAELLTRFAGQNKFKSFTNLPEAIKFLESVDPSLGTVPNPEQA